MSRFTETHFQMHRRRAESYNLLVTEKNRSQKLLLAAFSLVGVIFSLPAFGGRAVVAPEVYWNDFFNVNTWGGDGIGHCLLISVTAASVAPQTVTTSVTANNADYSAYAPICSPGTTVTIQVTQAGQPQTISSTAGVTNLPSFTGPPLSTSGTNSFTVSYCALYFNPANPVGIPPAPCPGTQPYGGDWHLTGSFSVTISVAEDRGAVNAVMNTTNDAMVVPGALPLVISDPPGLFAIIKNAPKQYYVNGGRPF